MSTRVAACTGAVMTHNVNWDNTSTKEMEAFFFLSADKQKIVSSPTLTVTKMATKIEAPCVCPCAFAYLTRVNVLVLMLASHV